MYEDWHDVLARHEPKAKGEGSGGPAFAAEVEGPESEGGEPAPETPINAASLGRVFRDKGAAHYLALRSGVSFSDDTLRRLKACGHGPVQQLADSTAVRRPDCDRWLSHVFGLEDLQAESFPAPEPKSTAPGAEPWLYLGPDSPNRDYILKELQADPFLLPEPEEAAPGVKP
jgi:hypothetical protein